MPDFPVNCFGGENSEGYNALGSALQNAAGGESEIYKFLEDTPKTSVVVELYDALLKLGYHITKK